MATASRQVLTTKRPSPMGDSKADRIPTKRAPNDASALVDELAALPSGKHISPL
jgi:hypothetical protein